jgi:peptidyl-prolyl cis-trans isomerase C
MALLRLAPIGALVGALALGLVFGAHAQTKDDPVVAKINGTEIKQSDLTSAEEDLGGNLPVATADAKRDYLVQYLTDMILVSKAAEAKRYDDTADFKKKMASARGKVLMELILQDEGKRAITDAAMHKVYDDAIKQMGDDEEVHARHILVEKEDDAKAIAAELKKGADFVELAKAKSIEPAAKESGGDLGYFTKDQMVPEFSTAAFKLDKGQVSDPVKSQFGWHIIKVEDKRKKPIPSFDQVKDQLQTYVTRKAQTEFVTKLRADAKIERLDKPADAAPAVAPDAATKK